MQYHVDIPEDTFVYIQNFKPSVTNWWEVDSEDCLLWIETRQC
jgi:hypothetical protein